MIFFCHDTIKKTCPDKKLNNTMESKKTTGWWLNQTNPFEKYARQNGNLPQINKYLSCHHLVVFLFNSTSSNYISHI